MFVNLTGGTQLEAEVELLAFHIAVNVVSCHVGYAGSKLSEGTVQLVGSCDELVGDGTDNRFEGTDALIELTLAAAAGHREIELERPVVLIISSLQRGDERSVCHALEFLCRQAVVLGAERKQRISRSDGTCLLSILPVESEVQSIAEECYASGIRINSVEADSGISCGVTKKIYALIGVCQNTTSKSGGSGCEHHCYADKFNLIHLKYL